MNAPIAIMSFNRPAYLEQTLQSLKAQAGNSLDGREIHLFQDGAVNAYSRLRYADDNDVNQSIELAKRYFPQVRIHFRAHNIGIAENFCRAEDYLFLERGFEFAYFFEDDMVLSPAYLQMMEILETFARSSPRVAYFSAYGNHNANPVASDERRRQLVNMGYHWAFGLRRTAWLQIREYLADYYEIVCGNDYARRDHGAIFDLFAATGVSPRASSQDAAKGWACDQLGLWRCKTFAPFARYIGSEGAHMTPALYDSMGFGRTIIVNEPVDDLVFPDDDGIDAKLLQQRLVFEAILRTELDGIRKSLAGRKLNPMRRCTADDIRAAYRLLLHRDPESPDIIARHEGKTAVFSLMRGLLESREFHDLGKRMDHP